MYRCVRVQSCVCVCVCVGGWVGRVVKDGWGGWGGVNGERMHREKGQRPPGKSREREEEHVVVVVVVEPCVCLYRVEWLG